MLAFRIYFCVNFHSLISYPGSYPALLRRGSLAIHWFIHSYIHSSSHSPQCGYLAYTLWRLTCRLVNCIPLAILKELSAQPSMHSFIFAQETQVVIVTVLPIFSFLVIYSCLRLRLDGFCIWMAGTIHSFIYSCTSEPTTIIQPAANDNGSFHLFICSSFAHQSNNPINQRTFLTIPFYLIISPRHGSHQMSYRPRSISRIHLFINELL
jgi:hypothetical protein